MEPELWLPVAAAFGAGFINAIAGGGTLLTFPALLATGMPAIAANATSTVAIVPGSAMSAWTYRREIAAQRRLAGVLAAPSLIGGLAGAILLLQTGEELFRFIVPYLILLACALLVLNEPIGRWMNARAAAHPKKHAAALWLCQFAIAVYGGYFGAGIGILMLAAMAIFLPESLQQANALKNLLATLINAVAVAYFLAVGAAVVPVALAMMGAAIAGGFVGARTAQKMPAPLLRGAVVVYGVIVAARMLL